MEDLGQAILLAWHLLASGDPELVEIATLSLEVSVSALALACTIGYPLGAIVGLGRFPGRTLARIVLNTLMGLPPVVVGLFVYVVLSGAGPLGWLRLLYTPAAMVIAQTLLITPIIAALTRQVIEDYHREYDELFRALQVPALKAVGALLWDARRSLLTAALAGFGRAIAEVGAVIIVGGNINHVTRVMTTAIALETAKGDLARALALGIILLVLSLAANLAAAALSLGSGESGGRRVHA